MMTDNEIIKALECCTKDDNEPNCKECPKRPHIYCMCELLEGAFDLIKRQKEIIEALISGQETLQKHFKEEKDKILEQLDTQYEQALSDYEDTYNPYYDGQMLAFDIAEQIVKGVQNE